MNLLREKIAKEMVNEFIEEEFQGIKSFIYKKLWADIEEGKESVLELPYNKNIIILNGKISFDNKKTFLHRSEEKLIAQAFEDLQKSSANSLVKEICDEHQKNLNRVEKARVEKVIDKHSSESNLLNELSKSDDDKEDIVKYLTLTLELEVIDEQIELLKEIGGNKEKLLSLLEEKHKLIKNFRNI